LQRFAQIRAALTAEFKLGGIGGITFRTASFQLGSAFPAKLLTLRILKLAFWALHVSPPIQLQLRKFGFSWTNSAYGSGFIEKREVSGAPPSGGRLREAKINVIETGPLHNDLEKGWSEPRWVGKTFSDTERGPLRSQADSLWIINRLQMRYRLHGGVNKGTLGTSISELADRNSCLSCYGGHPPVDGG
jgi:hypothetical protein